MNKELLKNEVVVNAKNAGWVLLGFIGGNLLAKGIDMGVSSLFPSLADGTMMKIVKPVLLAGGGYALAVFSRPADAKEKAAGQLPPLKGIGLGLVGAGAMEGVKSLPVVGEFLSGVDTNQLPANYYTENSLRNYNIGDFGRTEEIQDRPAEPYEVTLPELGAATTTEDPAFSFITYEDQPAASKGAAYELELMDVGDVV